MCEKIFLNKGRIQEKYSYVWGFNRFQVHCTLYIIVHISEKGFFLKQKNQILRVYHVFADVHVVIISFECIKNSSNCILNDQWIVAHNPKTL